MYSQEQFKKMQSGIEKNVPVMVEFFDYEKTLQDHSQSLYSYTPDPTFLERQKSVAAIMSQYIKKVFKKEYTFLPPLTINIVDHHAPLTHPMLVSTNIAGNTHQLLTGSKKPIIVFSSSIVPPNNFLNKKGFHLHEKSVSLFKNSEIHQAAYFIPKHDFHFLEKLKKSDQAKDFSAEEYGFLENFEKQITDLDFSDAVDYADQVGIINNFIWKKLFASEIQTDIPDLYYIPSEEIIREMCKQVVSTENFISRTLFDVSFRTQVLKAFDGVVGCWSEATGKGTHFFWYRSPENIPEKLMLDGETLRSADGSVQFSLDPQEIIPLLEEKRIIPSLFITYGWLVFWCGVKPLTGYGSSTYLTRMKQAWLQVLEGDSEVPRIESINPKGLIGGEVVTYKRNVDGSLQSQYALDIIFHGGLTKDYLEHISQMKFVDFLKPALPDIYTSYVPKSEQIDHGIIPTDFMGESFSWL